MLKNFRQRVKEKVSKVNKSELTCKEFVDGKNDLKAFRKILPDLISKVKAHAHSTTNLTKMSKELIEAQRKFAIFNKQDVEDSAVSQALLKFSEIHDQLNKLNEPFSEVLMDFAQKVQSFLDHEVSDTRKMKTKYYKARRIYDSCFNQLKKLQQKDTSDPKKQKALNTAESDLVKAKQTLEQTAGDVLFSIDDFQRKKDSEILQLFVNFFNAEKDFFYQGYGLVYDLFEYIKQLKTFVDDYRKHTHEQNRQMDLANLGKAQDEEEHKYDTLAFLLSSTNLSVVSSLIFASGSSEDILISLIRLYDAYDETRMVLHTCINDEVENTESESTLFRGNSTATKLMSAFTRNIGQKYLQEVLTPKFTWMYENPLNYEADPARCKEGDDAAQNLQNLKKVSQMFLDAILNSLPKCPLPFRCIASDLRDAVKKRFPEAEKRSVGGFIFLRFFCPTITNPAVGGIVQFLPSPPDKEMSRSFITITKVLQNIANDQYFDVKNPHLKELNSVIDEYRPKVEKFFDELSKIPDNLEYQPLANTEEVRKLDLPKIHQLFCYNIDKVVKHLHIFKHKDTIPKLFHALERIGPPPEKKDEK
ncbi:hypothetical protein M0811_00762 [Anaeramoeba ignava]|uniref:Uncharacterized protein n=1 Tax=Anaeramoeba ignava TaxID=1746090 RepID=A0A9Q0LKM1_ANAIG|nr:hypothetical protein M0811_00762 [Anaeramoeba ignava]|eukprot:Anaeramoba_ignava/a218721_49.p1 GENE.a218721_49~~a218721_49.p1  ORF type:complete len:588 (+),score=169.89 a218721_49:61-1824(+)